MSLHPSEFDLKGLHFIFCIITFDCLVGEVVQHPTRMREVAGSIPDRVILKTLKMVVKVST